MLISKTKLLKKSQVIGTYRKDKFITITGNGYLGEFPRDFSISCLGVELSNELTPFAESLLERGVTIDTDYGNSCRLFRVTD